MALLSADLLMERKKKGREKRERTKGKSPSKGFEGRPGGRVQIKKGREELGATSAGERFEHRENYLTSKRLEKKS